jgi:hypothetical protein
MLRRFDARPFNILKAYRAGKPSSLMPVMADVPLDTLVYTCLDALNLFRRTPSFCLFPHDKSCSVGLESI